MKRVFNVSWHGKVIRAFVVIPFESYAAEQFFFPVSRNLFVAIFDQLDKVIGMLFAYVFNEEIVDYKAVLNWAPAILPKSGSVLCLVVYIFAMYLNVFQSETC